MPLPAISIASIAAIAFIVGSLTYFYRRGTVTAGLIFTNVIVYVVSLVFPVRTVFMELAFKPVYLLPAYLPTHFYTIFTTMFLHSIYSPLHIMMNMLVLFLIGIELERRIGAKNFLATYLVSGIIATGFWGIINLGSYSYVPAVGASGAVFGILGALGYLYPRERITMFLGFFIMPNVPALLAVTAMGLLEVVYTAIGAGNVAHLAHIGGIFGGFAMAMAIKSRRGGAAAVSGAAPLRKTGSSNLQELYESTDADGKSILAKAIDEAIPEVRSAWLSEFAAKKRCPKCGGKLEEREGILRCGNGHEWR